MKRVGNLMPEFQTDENFILAERIMAKNKPDNRVAQHIEEHAEDFGKRLAKKVRDGTYHCNPYREKTIKDSYKGKERGLKIPCMEDQTVQIAWLNVATPYIMRKNYYYNCGSIPGAGQTRAVRALQKWLKNPKMKYAAVTDIRKFYDTCPHWAVKKGLSRIFKDRAFIEVAMNFLASMSDTGVGIAIGYPISHWLANIALMELDHCIVRKFPDVKMTRYMDDMAMVSTNKRHLQKAVAFLKASIESLGMRLKKWNLFRVRDRGVTFLSYRFFNGYTILTKPLMVRIARRMRKAPAKMSAHVAAGVMSYLGLLRYCDSFHFRQACVYPFANRRMCSKLIRRAAS